MKDELAAEQKEWEEEDIEEDRRKLMREQEEWEEKKAKKKTKLNLNLREEKGVMCKVS